ncbi:HAD family phosphatase [Parabacteroides sp. AM08-6]|uniref:HAD family hydrolase n=1 Tax=Parabacteroides sp. AM08-6 TaxID=2292053 RepID=UPI000EFE4278|nr:HAD family phosphatase [Parabacteroides sp. AM08-6]RHJ81901.1 HAD family phosphatase [Parabacteroides sp. AM08-6]
MLKQLTQLKTALFDFDGVIVDTEPIYDIYWNEAGERYGLGIKNFASHIKGTTLPYILDKYFSGYSEEFKEMVLRESMEFESQMPFPPVRGAMDFIHLLKDNGVKTGLVTSSDDVKVKRAFHLLQLDNLFDTVVTADRITRGKPDPMCYLLAASDLKVSPAECLVFEDSFAGVQAGSSAGMRVIGLSTTNSQESLQDKVYKVIPNFENITINQYKEW